jgi:hypothetical protein
VDPGVRIVASSRQCRTVLPPFASAEILNQQTSAFFDGLMPEKMMVFSSGDTLRL